MLKNFGSVLMPLRSSGLQSLTACSWRDVSFMLYDFKDEAGPAAATGSATHAAVAKYHSCYNVVKSMEDMHTRRHEYPLADLDDAAKLFFAYVQDPRNTVGNVVLIEQSVSFELPAAENDPTGTPIHIRGRLDQVREENGELFAFDLKTSTKDGVTQMSESLYQICAYSLGASKLLGKLVHPGALICPRQYFKRGCDPSTAPSGVFWRYTIRNEMCMSVLDGIRGVVASIRSGKPWVNSADYCRYCHYHGIDLCVPSYHEYLSKQVSLETIAVVPRTHT